MSDIGAGGFPGEANIASRVNIQGTGRQTWLQRQMFGRGGLTANVQASLKFDIPGLKDFRTELERVRTVLESLDVAFKKLATSPAGWAKSLKDVNTQLAQMRGNAGALGGSTTMVSGGTPGQQIPVAQTGVPAQSTSTTFGSARTLVSGLAQGQGMGQIASSLGASAGPAAILAGITTAISKGMDAAFNRFDRGMSTTAQADIYASRNALFTGQTARQIFAQQGRGMPFLGNFPEVNQVLNQLGMVGAIQGAQGIAGQRGAAAVQSINQMQALSPGMTAGQAGSVIQGAMSNVAGMKQALPFFGSAALMYKPGGGLKTLNEYFTGIMQKMQNLGRPNGQNGPWTREELEGAMMPGSRMGTWLTFVGMDPDLQAQFWTWAIARASSGNPANFNPTQEQMDKIRGGRSLATETQRLETRQGQREAAFGGQQYGTMLSRLDREEDVVGLLQSMDSHLSGIYSKLGGMPSIAQGFAKKGGAIAGGAAAGAALGLLGGPFAELTVPAGALLGAGAGAIFGDPEGSLTHLSPDLRDRVGQMMADNPNLSVTSAYRDNLRQEQLQGSGPFAPSGKSKHGMGQAIDIGPSSEFGWLAANAEKYGLGTAGHMGEPWHVQLSGTLGFMGDPQSDRLRSQASVYRQAFLTQTLAGASASGPVNIGQPGASATSGASPSGGTTDLTPGPGGTLNADQMVKLAYDAGFRGQSLIDIVGIAYRESHWNPGAYNPNAGTKDLSFGLTQINMLGTMGTSRLKQFGITKNEDLYDPATNMKSAFILSGGGTNLGPWGNYKGKSNTYNVPQSKLDEARAAAQKAGYLGDPYRRSAGAASGTGGMKAMTFNNIFNVTIQGSGGASVDNVAKQLSSRLEVQLRRAVSRTD